LSAGRRRGGRGKIADLFSGKYSGTQELFVDSTEFGTPAKARMLGCAFIVLYLQGESPNPSPGMRRTKTPQVCFEKRTSAMLRMSVQRSGRLWCMWLLRQRQRRIRLPDPAWYFVPRWETLRILRRETGAPHLPVRGYHPYPVRSPRYRIQGKTLKMENG
jgi:hypothetical protein